MKKNEIYPLGSLIVLKTATKPLISVSVKYDEKSNKIVYRGIPFPVGYFSDETYAKFYQEDIAEVQFFGYEDEEASNILNLLQKEIEKHM